MISKHLLAKKIKRILFGATETYCFNNRRLKFELGTRPVRKKYINSKNGIVRNDVLQIQFFEKHFKSEDVLWDIGSHFGHYSIFCASVAKDAGQVYSFEPDPFAASVQHRNIGLNKLGNKIQFYDMAVSDTNGDRYFHNQKGNSNSSIIKGPGKQKSDNIVVVESITLNALAEKLPLPAFIKIDVEGAEIDMLRNADKLLSNPSVCFICELHPFAWKDYDVSFFDLTVILNKYDRKLILLDNQKNESDLPFYGTVIF